MGETNDESLANLVSDPAAGSPNERNLVSPKRQKTYVEKSDVWLKATKIKEEDRSKPDQVRCNHCAKTFHYDSAQGTSTIWRHLFKCPKCEKNKDPTQTLINFSSASGPTGSLFNWKFDQEAG